jgi:hypothetical protein
VRVLLDEQMPTGLVAELTGHEVRTVGQLGWKGLENGQLLARAAGQFDVLISMDKNLPIEQDITQYRVGVVLLRAFSNRIESIRPLVPAIQRALAAVRPGEIQRVGA